MANATYPAVRHVAVGNRLLALWDTIIGKKVVMAITGAVLVLFVIAHMLGNLKIFSGANETNAYSRFLREVGSPGLAYGQLLWKRKILDRNQFPAARPVCLACPYRSCSIR